IGGLTAAQVILHVRDKDGKETTVKVPSGSEVTVNPDGKVEVKLPGKTAAENPAAGRAKTPAAPLPDTPGAVDPHRRVAEMVLKHGGRLSAFANEPEWVTISRLEDLPKKPFVLEEIVLDGADLNEVELQNLANLYYLRHLGLGGTKITDAGVQRL